MITLNYAALALHIKQWGEALGFQQVGITDTNLEQYEPRFKEWVQKKFHGNMQYMVAHGIKRLRPERLHPGTLRIISVRMDYLPPKTQRIKVLKNRTLGYISRYALGRDYHRLLRKRLQMLATKIQQVVGPFGFRAFADSAPVLEKPLAEKAGLGWIGKHTNLINRHAGSWFFLGELFTDLPLPIDSPLKNHCGSCTACIKICPTEAIIGPYQLDARRCISYLTIELKESIPIEFRTLIGNRIYGCDDCQLVCPWNRYAKYTAEKEFYPRHQLDARALLELFSWTPEIFLRKTEGSAIRRIGYERWIRNIAIALGNAPADIVILHALQAKLVTPLSDMVKEHINWALAVQA